MTLSDKIARLEKHRDGYWASRAWAQLAYATSLSSTLGGKFDEAADTAAEYLLEAIESDGCVTKASALRAEELLSPAAAEAKKNKVRCISHAHIDMNWKWGFQETAAVTVDTFRTMLALMDEYPDFTFAQSQASTYEIIEEYCPDMMDEIRRRVHEGRWEVTASTWVEPDKNMPNGESLCRHILYTKDYLSKLLDIPPESLELDFEPDTFGHNITVPEILTNGGVKYLYHCRGAEGPHLYNWRARSGASVLVYREPDWYNATVCKDSFVCVPQYCAEYGVDVMLKVYGVGDHGGGPTRRDIERLIDMSTWPIYPTVTFGTFHAYFKELEKFADKLPEVEGELNYIFTGCYTSQSRIKAANRISEDRLYESEALCAAASLLGAPKRPETFASAWKNVLFSHFHDILPGSGVIDTREYAMGSFQRVMAAANTSASAAMLAVGNAIDASSLASDEDCRLTIAEGAGVGFGTDGMSGFSLPAAERGSGKRRIFSLFNTTQYAFDSVAVITVWDWLEDTGRAEFRSAGGEILASQLIVEDRHYWGHDYKKFAVRVRVPALGYAVITLDEAHAPGFKFSIRSQRDHIDDSDIVLENELVRAVFSRGTAELLSFTDKVSGRELIGAPSCVFDLITENTVIGMTAWRVGNYKSVENINANGVTVCKPYSGELRSGFNYRADFGARSSLEVDVYLDAGSAALRFDVSADFHELGDDKKKEVPQLAFSVPVGYSPDAYRRDVPFGTLDTPAMSHDIPVNSFLAAVPGSGAGLLVTSDSKYGFRGDGDAVSVDLIRATYDPDPCPEYGMHHIKLAVCALPEADNNSMFRAASAVAHPVTAISLRPGKGYLPYAGSLFELGGAVRLSSVKNAENGNGIIIRLYDENGTGSPFTVTLPVAVESAETCDINENTVSSLHVDGRTVSGEIKPFGFVTVRVVTA